MLQESSARAQPLTCPLISASCFCLCVVCGLRGLQQRAVLCIVQPVTPVSDKAAGAYLVHSLCAALLGSSVQLSCM